MGRVDNVVLTEDQKELHRPQKKVDNTDYLKKDYMVGDSPFKYTDRKVNAVRGIGMARNKLQYTDFDSIFGPPKPRRFPRVVPPRVVSPGFPLHVPVVVPCLPRARAC